MKKKIMWGILTALLGVFYLIQQNLGNEGLIKYVLNYEVILCVIGVILIVEKKKIAGIATIIAAVYLFLQDFFHEAMNITFPALTIIAGLALLGLGIKERKDAKDKKEKAIYSTTLDDNNNVEVEASENEETVEVEKETKVEEVETVEELEEVKEEVKKENIEVEPIIVAEEK